MEVLTTICGLYTNASTACWKYHLQIWCGPLCPFELWLGSIQHITMATGSLRFTTRARWFRSPIICLYAQCQFGLNFTSVLITSILVKGRCHIVIFRIVIPRHSVRTFRGITRLGRGLSFLVSPLRQCQMLIPCCAMLVTLLSLLPVVILGVVSIKISGFACQRQMITSVLHPKILAMFHSATHPI